MGNVSKELLRNYIKEQKFTNADDILISLKGMFSDILQETLEAEMDEIHTIFLPPYSPNLNLIEGL